MSKLLDKKLRKEKHRIERNTRIEINAVKRHAQTNSIQFVNEAKIEIEKALS